MAYTTKTYSSDEDTERMLKDIMRYYGNSSASAMIRFAIHQLWMHLFPNEVPRTFSPIRDRPRR